jgi:hypothetical protein
MAVFNRLLWSLIGLLLIAIGAVGLVLGLGALGSVLTHTAPVPSLVPQHALAPTENDLIALAGAGLLALLLGLVLLRLEFQIRSRHSMRNLRYERQEAEQYQPRGRTVVRSGGLEHGLRQGLTALPDVRSAETQLVGDPGAPDLFIELAVDAEAQLSTLKVEVRQALEQFRLTSGRRPSTQIRIRLADARRSVD